MSTITAISSPVGAGGIGIVRVSGNQALTIANAIFIFSSTKIQSQDCGTSEEKKSTNNKDKNNIKIQNWIPLTMHFGTFFAEDFCDKGYAVFFPKEKAFTGEDTVEFYLHGGVRIMQGAVEKIVSQGAVLATKGEFTKRAFLSGKMSLADAEGVIDMINAESSAGLRASYRLMTGEISLRINSIMDKLIELISSLEATLDYPDEMEDEVLPIIPTTLVDIERAIKGLLSTVKRGKMAKHGITVVLAGDPNSGKSSLMNAFLKKERAIVTEIAGTTRDTISESIEIDGVRINLIDTAGLRDSEDIIERAGIERARREIENADIILNLLDTTTKAKDLIKSSEKEVFYVFNKSDLTNITRPKAQEIVKEAGIVVEDDKVFVISAKDLSGVNELVNSITWVYKKGEVEGGDIITSQRHISALYQAKTAIENAIDIQNETLDCLLIDLRECYERLGEITGKTTTEDVVENIFSRFCVGK